MYLKHHKTNAKILAHSNAAKRRNLHVKYIALKDRRRNKSEPALTRSGENALLHKTNRGKVNKTCVIANHHVRKYPQLVQKYPDIIKKSPNIVKKAIDIKNISNVQKLQNSILKTNNKFKDVTKSVTKKASTKSKQKIKPRAKQGGFTEKIVSMWHYAKTFLGLSSSNRQSTENYSMGNKTSKHSLPVKPKKAIYVVKKPLMHHQYKDLKESKNVIANQCYREKNIEKRKRILGRIKTPLILPTSKVNKLNCDLQYEIKSNINEKEQIKVLKQIELKDEPKKDIIGINTHRYLQYENKSNLNAKTYEDHMEAVKQMVLKVKPNMDKTVKITSLQQENNLTANMNGNEVKKHVLKNITVGKDSNDSVQYENKFKVANEANEKEQNELKVKPTKTTTVEINTNESLQYKDNVEINQKEQSKAEKQIVLKTKPKKDITVEIDTNELEQIEMEKSKKDIQIETNRCSQHENESKDNEEQIETDKQIVLKDKPMKDITLEINTNRPIREILTKANCYKSSLDGNNATIIIEIKNTSNNVEKGNTQIQPQTLNVNCAIESLDVHKNAENCGKNVLTLLNTCNLKRNNITQLITRGHSKVPVNNVKKFSEKVPKNKHNLDKKKQSLVKKRKNYHKTHHKDTKRCEKHKQRRSCKRHHHWNKYCHKHGCKNHKMKETKRRKCSTCRGYISTDDSQQGKAHQGHHKDKYDYKEHCHVCKKRVTCLYHHNKKNHKHNKDHYEKNTIRHKHHKKPKFSKKHPTPMTKKSFHDRQKKKRTLTVCTNSKRNSFKNKKLKRSVTYMSTQMKPSTSKILSKSSINSSISCTYVNFKRSRSSILRTDSDSDSDRHEATKVLSWWYLHYALNAVQQNRNDEMAGNSNDTEENNSFLIPYGEFCNVYEAVSKADSDDSSINENWNENFKGKSNFSKHQNSFTDEETLASDNKSFYSSIHNFDDLNMYDADTNTSCESSSINEKIPSKALRKSSIDLQATDDE